VTRLHMLAPISVLSAAVLIAGCGPMASMLGDGSSTECGGHPQPDKCRETLEAVVAELGESAAGARIRIDPVECAHGKCWTWAHVTPAGGGRDQQLSVDWLPNGEINVGYVVQH
jgi:hypothetical protein